MAHHIYHIDAFVIGDVNIGESHRYVSLLTKEIGTIRAMVRSVREERSKLRYSLQGLSRANVSLVRGRKVWRVTGASEQYSVYRSLTSDREKLLLAVRITNLLKRLLHGEEKNEYLFSTVEALYVYLMTQEASKEKRNAAELITVLRILYSLGYFSDEKDFSSFFKNISLDDTMLSTFSSVSTRAVSEINRSLKESHL